MSDDHRLAGLNEIGDVSRFLGLNAVPGRLFYIARFTAAVAVLGLLAAGMTGCEFFGSSEAWRTIKTVSVEGRGDSAESDAYAQKLHRALGEKGIENRIVHFRYTVLGRGGQFGETQSAIIYRNDSSARFPWWLMDKFHSHPVWLPNASVEEQLQFAERTPNVTVVEPEGQPIASAGIPPKKNWVKIFFEVHGTRFDSSSAIDKKKMELLKERRR